MHLLPMACCSISSQFCFPGPVAALAARAGVENSRRGWDFPSKVPALGGQQGSRRESRCARCPEVSQMLSQRERGGVRVHLALHTDFILSCNSSTSGRGEQESDCKALLFHKITFARGGSQTPPFEALLSPGRATFCVDHSCQHLPSPQLLPFYCQFQPSLEG